MYVFKMSDELVAEILTVSSLDGRILGDFSFLLCEFILVISKTDTVNICDGGGGKDVLKKERKVSREKEPHVNAQRAGMCLRGRELCGGRQFS